MYNNKNILITGGTGSFGNAVAQKMLKLGANEVRIFSRDEKKQNDMRLMHNTDRLKFFIGDVRDKESLKEAINEVDFVFHAAALKQVPSCEFFPLEAVKTNILGTENVLNIAIENQVKKVICLSTDKAVYPINAMGISKAMMEKVFVAKARSIRNEKTVICGTRYGNVMASRGSVIPLFVEQIKTNKPVTITNPNMTRFMMSLNEAVELVEYAFENGNQGDLFVQKSPSTTIYNLALALFKIFEKETQIEIIGTRHGEKQFETLLSQEESVHAYDNGKYFRIPMDQRSLNYNKYFTEGNLEIDNIISYNSNNTEILSVENVIQKLLTLDYIQNELSTL